jgi:hypothetical protein
MSHLIAEAEHPKNQRKELPLFGLRSKKKAIQHVAAAA